MDKSTAWWPRLPAQLKVEASLRLQQSIISPDIFRLHWIWQNICNGTRPVQLSSQPSKNEKLSHPGISRHRARRGLLTAMPRYETKQKRNQEQQISRAFLPEDVIGTGDTEWISLVITLANVEINLEQPFTEAVIAKPRNQRGSLSSAINNYKMCMKNAKYQKMENMDISKSSRGWLPKWSLKLRYCELNRKSWKVLQRRSKLSVLFLPNQAPILLGM